MFMGKLSDKWLPGHRSELFILSLCLRVFFFVCSYEIRSIAYFLQLYIYNSDTLIWTDYGRKQHFDDYNRYNHKVIKCKVKKKKKKEGKKACYSSFPGMPHKEDPQQSFNR